VTAKQIDLVERVTVNLLLLVGGWVLLYLLCWLFESGSGGHEVLRWSDARCGFAILGTLLAFAFKRQADGERP
jgi:hypothetical protein